MKHISFFVIIDNIFKIILLTLFNLIWCFYFFKNGILSLSISVFIAIVATIIVNKINSKKRNTSSNKLKEEQRISEINNTFIFMSKNEILNFFYNLATLKHNAISKNNYIEIKSESQVIILCPIFKSGNLLPDDVLDVYKKIKTENIKRLIFLTNNFENNIQSITSHFDFETIILNHRDVYYNLLVKYNYYPDNLLKIKPKAKNTFKQLLSLSFNKKKTKGYLLSALFIFFASFFVRYKIYYCLISSTLVLFAIFSYFNPKFNKISKINLLE